MNGFWRLLLVWLLLAVIPTALFLWAGWPAMGCYLFGMFLITGVLVVVPSSVVCPRCGLEI